MTVIQRCRHRHIHTEIDREKRGHVKQNLEKCYSTEPDQHLHRLCTEQLQGVAFSTGHDMTGPQVVQPKSTPRPWDPQFLQQVT